VVFRIVAVYAGLDALQALAASVGARAFFEWNADRWVERAGCVGVRGGRCGGQRGESSYTEETEDMHSAVPLGVQFLAIMESVSNKCEGR
jgi:hypothetical protein